MPLIASTVYNNGGILGVIVWCTEDEYKEYVMHDKINENQVSVTFLKNYLKEREINVDDLIKKHKQHALAGDIGVWTRAYTITIPNLKEILDMAEIDYHNFIDAYCEYLKNL